MLCDVRTYQIENRKTKMKLKSTGVQRGLKRLNVSAARTHTHSMKLMKSKFLFHYFILFIAVHLSCSVMICAVLCRADACVWVQIVYFWVAIENTSRKERGRERFKLIRKPWKNNYVLRCSLFSSFTNHLKPKLKLIAFDSVATFIRSISLSPFLFSCSQSIPHVQRWMSCIGFHVEQFC